MLEKILKELSVSHTLTDAYGVFLSCFDSDWSAIASQWTIQATKPLDQIIPVLYNALDASNKPASFVVDIVKDVVEHTDKDSFVWLDVSVRGMCVVGEGSSWVLLPWTVGISSSKDALSAIKKKYTITGKVRLYSFATDRIVVQ
jgi:hypothetical protein